MGNGTHACCSDRREAVRGGCGQNFPLFCNGKLYTPRQIRLGSFLGGPIAAVYFLRENFRALDKTADARRTVVWGVGIVAGMMLIIPFLPDHFPNYIVPLAYSYAAGSVAEKWQLERQAILASETYQIHSNWRVFGLSLLFLAASTLIFVVEIFCLISLGWVRS